MFHEKRYFDNPYPDFTAAAELKEKGETPIINQDKNIEAHFIQKLVAATEKLLETLKQYSTDENKDGSVYSGSAGIALMYMTLGQKPRNRAILERAADLLESSLETLKNKNIGFVCGDAGPLALGAVAFYETSRHMKSKECISQLLGLTPDVIKKENQLPNELFYGRVGYLYSLMLVSKYISGTIPKRNITQVIDAIFESGKKLAVDERLEVPLMFEWNNKKYLGGAHGVAGILYLLLQCREYLTAEYLQLIRAAVEFILSLRYPSGNFPSSVGSNTDLLVHWCHGAPGTVHMLCEAYKVYKDKRYLRAAEGCGDVVWERGLLRKGYGLCHGVAGNAYTFLVLFQLTKEAKHLYRACKFAEWCTTYNEFQERTPDRPYSLFEGLAGTIYFLNDMKNPLQAKFPCFTL